MSSFHQDGNIMKCHSFLYPSKKSAISSEIANEEGRMFSSTERKEKMFEIVAWYHIVYIARRRKTNKKQLDKNKNKSTKESVRLVQETGRVAEEKGKLT